MTFRSIGVLADEMLRKELAARGHTNGAHKLDGSASGGHTDPMLSGMDGMGRKGRGIWLTPAVGAAREDGTPRGTVKLVVCNDGTRAFTPTPLRGSPAPARVPSLRIVGGRDHSANFSASIQPRSHS